MPRQLPSYRHYKPKNLGMVVIRRRPYYLCTYDSPESWRKYHRILAEESYGQDADPAPEPEAPGPPDLTINELVLTYWTRHVVSYYVKNGRPTSEQDNIRQALRFVRAAFGSTPARSFSTKSLKTVRKAMIAAGRCRKLINKDINRVGGMFRWATEEELYSGESYQALRAVQGLAKDRTAAKERPPGGPGARRGCPGDPPPSPDAGCRDGPVATPHRRPAR
jgi:hypothetical protein